MTKIGLIGCGFMGSMHAACYRALGATVAAVADLRREKAEEAAALFGAEIYQDAEELITKADVDTLDICLPTYLHTKYAVIAMEKGENVFLEKPVCLTMEEAERLLEVKNRTRATIMIGQVIRSWDEYVYLKNVVDSKVFGEIQTAAFKRVSPYPTWAWEGWLHDAARSGSMALDMHIHDVDFMRSILGEPDEFTSMAQRDNEGTIQHIFTSYKFGSAVANIECCWDYPQGFPFSAEYRIKFEKASLALEGGRVMVYNNDGTSYEAEIKKETLSGIAGGNISDLGGYYNELKYFVNCLKTGSPIEIATLEESVKSLNLVLREIESVGGAKR